MDVSFFPSREILLTIGTYSIRWYGLMYVISLWLTLILVQRLQKYRSLALSIDVWMSIVLMVSAAVLVGGRLGYVVLYEPSFFIRHPWEIAAVWRGGMASHGGILGGVLGMWIMSRRQNISFFALLDICTVPMFLSIMLGRFGNFLNQELFMGSWALVASALNAGFAAVSYFLLRNVSLSFGTLAASMLILYSIERLCMDYVRSDHVLVFGGLSMVQMLSVMFLVIGAVALYIISRYSYAKS